MSMNEETIVAIATPPGAGGIGIVRISGTQAERILTEVFSPFSPNAYPPKTHMMIYGHLHDGKEILDEGMAVLMRAPASYTREDVAELQLHGGSYILNRCVALCTRHGARLAEAGEFTRRAFINGRIDLSKAEAVMSMINAVSMQEHRAAVREMEGGATAFVRQASDELYAIQAGLAACIDYPDEVSDEDGVREIVPRLEHLITFLEQAADERTSRLLRDGLQVVLIGRPNVGKSSLLNALLNENRAIVTEIPGTTRDTVSGEIILNGIRVCLTDTAGMRETDDPVEKIGVERSQRVLRDADVAILVLDGSRQADPDDLKLLNELPPGSIVAVNKSDLPAAIRVTDITDVRPDVRCITCSTFEQGSMEPIKELLAGYATVTDRIALTQPRHLDVLRRTAEYLRAALETLQIWTPDMASTDLQAAQEALAEITGDKADEKLLDAVFSQFCVGK